MRCWDEIQNFVGNVYYSINKYIFIYPSILVSRSAKHNFQKNQGNPSFNNGQKIANNDDDNIFNNLREHTLQYTQKIIFQNYLKNFKF